MQYTKQIDRIIETDVLVIGGGSAGFGAAGGCCTERSENIC